LEIISKQLKANSFIHIYNNANRKNNLFYFDDNYNYFLSLFFEHISPIASIYSYCLLPNNFHFLSNVLDRRRLTGKKIPVKDFGEPFKKGRSIKEWKEYLELEPEKAHPSDNITSIGRSKKDGKWYGWSHRAINGFKTREQAIKFAESVS
jgi:hypothetical protein